MSNTDNNIFKRDSSEYKVTMLPTRNYINQITKYIATKKNLTLEEANVIAMDIIKHSNKIDPVVTYRARDDKGDRAMTTNTLKGYLNEVVANGEIITPTFTVLDHPDKRKSLHANFLDINIQKRKDDKHKAFKYKQLGDKEKFLHYHTLQKVRKIFNNSLSGAYASKSTILYHPAAHSILTSITRSVASIGNSVSESVIAGNKHFKDPEATINYIVSIITHVDMNGVEIVVETNNLHKPSPAECMEMVLYSSKNYWSDTAKEQKILELLTACTPIERCAILYVNDLFNLKKYNNDFVYKMLTTISQRVEYGSDNHLKDIYGAPEGIMNLVHHICMEDIKGKTVEYDKMAGTDLLRVLASTARNVTRALLKYRPIFRAFFTTDILPVTIADMRDMLRDAIVLSDTDSTCGSYDTWVEWYFGNTKFSTEAVALAATVMTINTQVIDHNIKVFAKNMNIKDDMTDLLKMKNEFFWSSFITANVNKHYYAETWIQEGNVFAEPDPEVKGVHLIASAIFQEITEEAKVLMVELNHKITNNIDLDPYFYIKKVADIERKLIAYIKEGNINIFKTEKIKHFSSYKDDVKEKTPYYNHMLWNEVFADKYGSPGEPEYMSLKVPTTLDTKNKTITYINSIADTEIRNKLMNAMVKFNKDKFGIFRVPLAIAGGRGIPVEIINAVDSKRMVTDNLNIMYIILETIGIYKKDDMLLSEMGY